MEQRWSLTCVHMSAVERVLTYLTNEQGENGDRVWGKRGLVLCDISHSLVNSSISVSQRHLKFKLNIFPESVPSFLLLQCISTLLRNTVNCLAFFPLLSWSSLYIPLSHECFSIVSRLFLLSLPHQHCTNFSLHHFAFKVRRHNSFAYFLSYSIF